MKESSIALGYVILHVPDVSATATFYRKAFGLEVRFAHESGEYLEFETGLTVLALAAETLIERELGIPIKGQSDRESGAEIALVTSDVEAMMERALSAGGRLAKAVSVMAWGQKLGYVRDPNGFLVEICEPVS